MCVDSALFSEVYFFSQQIHLFYQLKTILKIYFLKHNDSLESATTSF